MYYIIYASFWLDRNEKILVTGTDFDETNFSSPMLNTKGMEVVLMQDNSNFKEIEVIKNTLVGTYGKTNNSSTIRGYVPVLSGPISDLKTAKLLFEIM